jgi:hypothetical protein
MGPAIAALIEALGVAKWAPAIRVNFDGDNIFSLLLSNPLSGLPHDMYALLCLVFPFGFFFRMACAYIAWNLTFQGAAILVSRGVKFLFGG